MATNPLSKLPTWGKFAVVGGGGAVIVFAWYQHKQSAAASSTASSSSADQIDPATGLPYSEDNTTDPETDMTYAAEAEQYGSVSAAEAALGASANYGYDTGSSAGIVGDYYDQYPATDNTASGYTYSSNAEWAQAAEAGLTDIGYSSTDVASAIGRYLARLSLTADQANIVQVAIAEYGNPPSGTFQIIQSSGTPTQGSGTGGASVPNVVGMDITDAANTVRAAGLNWNGPPSVKGQVIYVTGQTPAAGTSVASGATVTVTVTSTATVTVPNVVGKPIDQAGPEITAAGLKYSGPAPVKGKVVTITSQTPAAGTKVDPGTTIRCTGKS